MQQPTHLEWFVCAPCVHRAGPPATGMWSRTSRAWKGDADEPSPWRPCSDPWLQDPRPPCHHEWHRYRDLSTDFMQLSDVAITRLSELPAHHGPNAVQLLSDKQHYMYLMSRPYCKYIDRNIIGKNRYRYRCGQDCFLENIQLIQNHFLKRPSFSYCSAGPILS